MFWLLTMYGSGACGGQKMGSEPLELELQGTVGPQCVSWEQNWGSVQELSLQSLT